MMCQSPVPLEDQCLDAICDYFEQNGTICANHGDEDGGEFFLFRELSEKLLGRFVDRGLVCNKLLTTLFNGVRTKLRSVKLVNKSCYSNATGGDNNNDSRISGWVRSGGAVWTDDDDDDRQLTRAGLQVFKQHKIVELECLYFKQFSIGNILDSLSDWSTGHLTHANFAGGTFTDAQRHSFMVKVTQLKSLRSLNLSYTELNQRGFEMICQDLVNLEKIDVSGTYIDDLRPLGERGKQLTGLGIADLPRIQGALETIPDMSNLRHLDMSLYKLADLSEPELDDCQLLSLFTALVTRNDDIVSSLPNLVSLDLSGWGTLISSHMIIRFVQQHPDLRYLGLVLTQASFDRFFAPLSGTERLIVGGVADECQIEVALTRYKNKIVYCQKSLYYLFQLTAGQSSGTPPKRAVLAKMVDLILPIMAAHRLQFGVQIAATACLYNLTRGELSKNVHVGTLARIVTLTLISMETFPKKFQLQKNALLILCSDTVLQEVTFDRFKCAKLVLDSLLHFDDVNMNRMAVAICSILAAKINTKLTSELGSSTPYMRKLLSMVQHRVDRSNSDITLKFTLSALWNLTDESAATCDVFLKLEGADLFLKVLKTFKNDSDIETKVLGLLNNIAEVRHLRHNLMTCGTLVDQVVSLMECRNIDVSYFAAGIVAHLAAEGEDKWACPSHGWGKVLSQLEAAVRWWAVPDAEMVAYRSFRPFFGLLDPDVDHRVQLWAVWAIRHVCTKNPRRYCVMLREETGHLLLQKLVDHPDCDEEISRITSHILEVVSRNV